MVVRSITCQRSGVSANMVILRLVLRLGGWRRFWSSIAFGKRPHDDTAQKALVSKPALQRGLECSHRIQVLWSPGVTPQVAGVVHRDGGGEVGQVDRLGQPHDGELDADQVGHLAGEAVSYTHLTLPTKRIV